MNDAPTNPREAYLSTAPHPEQLPSFFAKSVERMREFKAWTPAQLRTIGPPTLLVVGDRDIVRAEHAVQMQHLLPDARLAVFPAADHLAMTERAAELASMLDDFLLRGPDASRDSRR
jgi:pimeloyl-ACP methyl ester carboxylesterase